MAYLVQTLASGLDLTSYAHLILHDNGFLVSSPARHCIYYVENGVATVWAGSDGVSGSVNGSRLSARFNTPCGLTKDNDGNIYLSDKLNHVIRKIDTLGNVTVVAGSLGFSGSSGDNGQATSALLDSPTGLSFSQMNLGAGRFNALFVLCANEVIRYVNLDNGNIYLARNGFDGAPTGYLSASFRKPNVYYQDTTLVFIGNKGAPDAWWSPYGVLTYLYIDQNGIQFIQQWGGSGGYYHVVNDSALVDVDYRTPQHYFTTPENKIYKFLGIANSEVVFAGTGVAGFNGDGEALQTQINNPTFILNDNTGIYFIDSGNGRVRKVVQSEIAYFDPPIYSLQSNLVPTSIIEQSPSDLVLLGEYNFQGGVLENIQFNYDVQLSEINLISKVNQAVGDLLIHGFTTDLKVSFYFEPIVLSLSQEIIPIVGAFEFVSPATYELGNDLFSDFSGDYDLIKSEEISPGYDLIQSKEISASYDITEFNQLNSIYDLIKKQDIDIIYSREKHKDLLVRYTHSEFVFASKESQITFANLFSTKEVPILTLVFTSKQSQVKAEQLLFVSKESELRLAPLFATKETPISTLIFTSKQSQVKAEQLLFASKQSMIKYDSIFATKEVPISTLVFALKQSQVKAEELLFVSKESQNKMQYLVFHSKETLFVIPSVQYYFFSKESEYKFEQSAGVTFIDATNEHFWLEHKGVTIPISKYDISLSNEIAWKGQVEINNDFDYYKLKIGDVVYLHIPSQVFKLLIITKNISKQGLQKRSFGVSLESPISALNSSRDSLTLGNDFASALANQIYQTEWDLVDWKIPPSSLVISNGTPLNLLKQLVDCVGGVIASKHDGSLLARSKFKYAVDKWNSITPEFVIPIDHIFSESLTSQAVKQWDSVIVSSGEAKEINYAVETIDVDKQKYLICRPSIWRDDIYLFHTSQYPTGIRYIGALEEIVEEQIEIKEGKASISKPVSELIEYNYHWKDLGLLEIINNELVLVSMPENRIDAYSLINVKYKTKFHKWAIGGSEGDTAQFVFVAEKEF